MQLKPRKMAKRAKGLVPGDLTKNLQVAALAGAGKWAMGKLQRKRQRPNYGAYAAKGLAAAAVAVPLGILAGNLLRSRGHDSTITHPQG